jgi:hypothetical protein
MTTARDDLIDALCEEGAYTAESAIHLADTHHNAVIEEAITSLHQLWLLAPDSERAPGLNFAIGALMARKKRKASQPTPEGAAS